VIGKDGGVDEAPTVDGPFSDSLERWLESDGVKTLGAIGEVFAEKSFAVTVVLLMIVPATPLPTGGITHVFGAIAVVLGAEMAAGLRTIWLPKRWQAHPLGPIMTEKGLPFVVRSIRRVERLSRPRGAGLLRLRTTHRVIGLMVIVFSASAALAPPFSGLDTLPALGAVLVALGFLLEDIVVVAFGVVSGIGGIALILTVGAAVFRLLRSLI